MRKWARKEKEPIETQGSQRDGVSGRTLALHLNCISSDPKPCQEWYPNSEPGVSLEHQWECPHQKK